MKHVLARVQLVDAVAGSYDYVARCGQTVPKDDAMEDAQEFARLMLRDGAVVCRGCAEAVGLFNTEPPPRRIE